MKTAQKHTHSFVTWRERGEGGAGGIVTSGLDTPHYLEIDKHGHWALQTLDANDKPIFVEQGSARNVAKARAAAEAAVRGLVTNTEDDTATTQRSYQASSRPEQAGWVRTLKVYVALSLLCFAALLFGRWMLLYRPSWFARVLFWGGSSIILAHRIIVFTENASKRLDKIRSTSAPRSTLKPTPHLSQPMQMPRPHQRKALPRGKR